jgi:arylsulfatase A-like enzyme
MSRASRHGRRAALGAAGAVLAAFVAACGDGSNDGTGGEPASLRPVAKGPERPNVIVIETDDQSLAQATPRTMPHTFRLLARRGTLFENYVVTTPVCCPSRASLLTGNYAHNHRVLSNGPGYPALRGKDNTLPAWLRRVGYRTAHVGKYLNHYPNADPAPGWSDWFTMTGDSRYYDYDVSDNGSLVHFGEEPGDYIGRVINRESLRIVRGSLPSRRPLYLQIDQHAPHVGHPHLAGHSCQGTSAEPDPDDDALAARAPVPRPRSFNEANVRDKPSFIRHRPPLTTEEVSEVRRRYRCAVASLVDVDRGVRQVYEAVRRAGELADTAFVFTSDNGYLYGEHRIPEAKQEAYDEALRQPLVVLPPAVLRGRGPRRSAATVANIDLAPTILALARARPCAMRHRCRVMDGRSLVPLLRGRRGGFVGRRLVIEFESSAKRSARDATCAFSGLRTPREAYIEHSRVVRRPGGPCVPSHEVEHYDLRADPYELHNLAYRPSAREKGRLAELSGQLARLRRCAGIRGRDPRPPGGVFCE